MAASTGSFYDDLDDVVLSRDEYREMKLYYPYLLPVDNQNFGGFHYATDSSSNDSSPERVLEPLQGDAVPVMFDLRATISKLVDYAPSEWNNIRAETAYTALKVSSYIVKPNYFLSASLHKEVPDEYSHMDHIMRASCARSLQERQFAPWEEVEGPVMKFLEMFDVPDCKEIPNILSSDPNKSIWLLRSLARSAKSVTGHVQKGRQLGFVTAAIKHMVKFTNILITAAEKENFEENISQEYVSILLDFFANASGGMIFSREKRDMQLSLPVVKGAVKVIPLIPDFYITCCGTDFLVGEIKRFGLSPKSCLENNKGKSKTKHGDKCQDDSLAAFNEGFEQQVNIEPSKEGDLTLPGSAEAAKSGCNLLDDDLCLKSQNSSQHEAAHAFRPLKGTETFKVRIYLPQLIAEMLASMQTEQNECFHLATHNEQIQLGFAVEGFKLRFVRLVLCMCDGSKKPIVEDIKDPRCKCHVFMTKEFNLFNKRHLKMFFMYLYAFTYLYS